MYSINSVTIVGHLGADADIRTMQNNQQVATLSIATDHSYKDKNTGEWIKRTEWHRVVTFQQGLVSVLEKHARKGRLTAVQGMLRTRKWTDQNNVERYTTEILVTPVAKSSSWKNWTTGARMICRPPAARMFLPPIWTMRSRSECFFEQHAKPRRGLISLRRFPFRRERSWTANSSPCRAHRRASGWTL